MRVYNEDKENILGKDYDKSKGIAKEYGKNSNILKNII
jgi:hypothetical protein